MLLALVRARGIKLSPYIAIAKTVDGILAAAYRCHQCAIGVPHRFAAALPLALVRAQHRLSMENSCPLAGSLSPLDPSAAQAILARSRRPESKTETTSAAAYAKTPSLHAPNKSKDVCTSPIPALAPISSSRSCLASATSGTAPHNSSPRSVPALSRLVLGSPAPLPPYSIGSMPDRSPAAGTACPTPRPLGISARSVRSRIS